MPLEHPKYPDWNRLGVPPEPMPKHDYEFFDGSFFQLPTHDPNFEADHRQWVENLSPKHRAIYDEYLLNVRNWVEQGENELRAMQDAEYEASGLEAGVNTPHELQVARNQAILFKTLDQIRTEANGREANAQLEDFFRHRSES
ncbi:MAG: hypothetical protein Q8L37_04960 [Candidatus Gottesmanbacteria bacterium]|nr:hypothetical protein [Candidatus Gottesmanbacteria bacterium]